MVSSDGKRKEFPMDIKEYNRLRYRSTPRRNFENDIRSYVKKLQTLGYTVTPPPDDQLDAAIENYLANRPRRERIDWGAVE